MGLKKSTKKLLNFLKLILFLSHSTTFSMQRYVNDKNSHTADNNELWGLCPEENCPDGYIPRMPCRDMEHLKTNVYKHYRDKHKDELRQFYKKFKQAPSQFIAPQEMVQSYKERINQEILNMGQIFKHIKEEFKDSIIIVSNCPVCHSTFDDEKEYFDLAQLIIDMKTHYTNNHPEIKNIGTVFSEYKLFEFYKIMLPGNM